VTAPAAGWFPDPENPKQTRWWDGQQWTAQTAPPPPPTGLLPPPAERAPVATVARKIPTWLWITGGLVAVLATVFLSPLVALIALVVAITGIVALARNTPTWLRFTSRKRAVIWTVASAVVFFVAGSISTAVYPTDDSSAGDEPAAVATTAATPTPTPNPTPFADDEAAPVAFTGEAGTAKDTSATADQSALAVLATLEVKGRAPKTGYDRDEFGQRWLDVDRNGCDTRNDILARDLADIVRSGPCQVTSGSLLDPFTGTEMVFVRGQGTSELVQIDHVVSLSDAWQKGAQQLTADQRATFANDPLNLLAVDGTANAQKGDGDAATWLPANRDFRCTYVARQVAVKATYGLWVTQAERDAMHRVLETCPTELAPSSGFAAPAPQPVPAPAPAPAPVPEEPAPASPSNTFYANCDAVRAAGASPLYAGSPGYSRKLDRDGDGVACE